MPYPVVPIILLQPIGVQVGAPTLFRSFWRLLRSMSRYMTFIFITAFCFASSQAWVCLYVFCFCLVNPGTSSQQFERGVRSEKCQCHWQEWGDIWGSRSEVWEGQHHRSYVKIPWNIRVPRRVLGEPGGAQLPQVAPLATPLVESFSSSSHKARFFFNSLSPSFHSQLTHFLVS